MTARKSRHPVARRVSGAIIAAALLLAACESRLPTSAEVEAMDAKTAVARLAALPGVDTARTVYMLDGKTVSTSEAGQVMSGKIASIEVVKGGDRTPMVRMRTRAGGDTTMMIAGTKLEITPLRSRTGFDGVFIIDGKSVSSDVANRLNPNSISSIEVVKGEAARLRSSDPRAVNGIILITTKNH